MQIILASAKIMNSKTAVSVPEKTVPVFSSKAERFALEMSSWDVETLAKRLNCSNSIALENQLECVELARHLLSKQGLFRFESHPKVRDL